MMAIGRFGGIAGSFLVAELARRQYGIAGIFTVVSVAGLIAAIALVVKYFASPEKTEPVGSRGTEALGH
jgi:AAHS family 4-hydroxybenzoate transporter-like MFS transporter